jgi:hypothetical protein
MTDEVIYLPPFPLPAKPPKWSACNGCGWCCHQEICSIGKTLLKLVDDDNMIPHFVKGPCPLMDFSDGKVRCGVVIAELECKSTGHSAPPVSEMLGIGAGCDADDPDGADYAHTPGE